MRAGLPALGVPATEPLVARFAGFIALLARWNRAYNLTSIREAGEMVPLHILDSLTARPWLAGEQILDVGAGAGLPGIPLALTEPGRRFTLVDATLKKVLFMRQAIGELKIENARAEQARIEDFVPVERFDTVICRAFAALADFVRDAGHLAVPGGRLVAMKGRLPSGEIAALPADWQVESVNRVQVPGLDVERHIVVVTRA